MPPTRGRHQPWYASLTLDLVLHILQNSIFHPYVASLIPLCLRAAEVPYRSDAFTNTVIYAAFICLLWLLAPLNERLAYGPRRRVSQDDEVVVITGGAGGLGHCLAEIYARKGIATAVLDVLEPKDRIEGVEYYQCDVSDSTKLSKTFHRIEAEVGPPTVLINNAGVVANRPFLELSSATTSRVLSVNTVAQFDLAAAFLRSLIAGSRSGTLVTVSSVLGRLGAAHLSAYTASKAALIAYHNSVTAELMQAGHSQIKTILVTPGQLSTDMFAEIDQNPMQRFFGPVVEVQQLALAMVAMIGKGRGGVLAQPAYARWIGVLEVLPAGLASLLRRLAGVDTAMQNATRRDV